MLSTPSVLGSSLFLELLFSFWYLGVLDGTLPVDCSRHCLLYWELALPCVSSFSIFFLGGDRGITSGDCCRVRVFCLR